MAAIVEGLLELFQWLAGTVAGFFAWLWAVVTGVLRWVWSVVDAVLATAWNWFIEFLTWAISALFSILGVLLVLPIKLLTFLASLLPPVPTVLLDAINPIVPAFSVADRILPVSDAILAFSLWGTFYGLMAIWRIITFIRGGR